MPCMVVTGAVFPSVMSLQRVPRRAPPMLARAMFTHAVTPDLLVWCPKWSACTVGVVWECRSVKIPVYI